MREAVRNERLASDQRLREAYQTQLQSASQQIQEKWARRAVHWIKQLDESHPPGLFSQIVGAGQADSALIFDSTHHLVYPTTAKVVPQEHYQRDSRWKVAVKNEFQKRDFQNAGDLYNQILMDSSMPSERAYARQSQIRCLLQTGKKTRAIELLEDQRLEQAGSKDTGRSFIADAELQLLKCFDHDSEPWNDVLLSLTSRLSRYDDPSLDSSQRLFLMSQVEQLSKEPHDWLTRDAEELALELSVVYQPDADVSGFARTTVPNIWSESTAGNRVVALYRTSTLESQLLAMTEGLTLPRGLAFRIIEPHENRSYLMDTQLGSDLAGWRLGLSVVQPDLFDESSSQRRAVHVWIAALVVAATCILAWLLLSVLRRRLRVAQMKNDLVATVSHELKTPLAATRLLVDTLLNSGEQSLDVDHPDQTREYLMMISHENARLTRLIDNFLTFSRLERGKQRLNSETIDLSVVVSQATALFREHVSLDEGQISVESQGPAIMKGDRDMLVTAIVNLLENAWKYSGNDKQIELSIRADGKQIFLDVKDNGIGMSKRSKSRVFDRFFQVDQRVARTHQGVGLGLSIVREIVCAHGGNVRIESEQDVGTTITLRFPISIGATNTYPLASLNGTD